MFTAVVACDSIWGIGKNGKMPKELNNSEDKKHFVKLTKGNTVIMGHKTFEETGVLKDRMNIVLSNTSYGFSDNLYIGNGIRCFNYALDCYGDKYIIGGSQVYRYFLEKDIVSQIIVSRFKNLKLDCDRYFPIDMFNNFNITDIKQGTLFDIETWTHGDML